MYFKKIAFINVGVDQVTQSFYGECNVPCMPVIYLLVCIQHKVGILLRLICILAYFSWNSVIFQLIGCVCNQFKVLWEGVVFIYPIFGWKSEVMEFLVFCQGNLFLSQSFLMRMSVLFKRDCLLHLCYALEMYYKHSHLMRMDVPLELMSCMCLLSRR